MFNVNQLLEIGPGYQIVTRTRILDDVIWAYYNDAWGDETSMAFHLQTGIAHGYENNDTPHYLRPRSPIIISDEFYIHAGRTDWAKEHWLKLPQFEPFDSGKDAATKVKELNEQTKSNGSDARFMVQKGKKEANAAPYDVWAQQMFDMRVWTPVPWATEEWAKTELTAHHFAHFSIQHDLQVAYFADPDSAAQSRVTRQGLGAYLHAFYSHILTPNEIRDWVVKIDVPLDLKLATTEEEMLRVYHEGPHSCMVYKDGSSNFARPDHLNPMRVLNAGDLAVAYIERNGKIIGRAIVWPEKKAVMRRYGDIERLEISLAREGYQLDCAGSGAHDRGQGLFNGARLLAIKHEGDSDRRYMMPYMDYGYGVKLKDDHFILEAGLSDVYRPLSTDGTYYAVVHDANGRPISGNTSVCDDCEDEVGDDHYVTQSGDTICEECISDYSCCQDCDEYVSDSTITSIDGYPYCRSCVGENFSICDGCSDHVHNDSTCGHNGNTYCDDCYSQNTRECERCHETVDVEEVSNVFMGGYNEQWCNSCHEDHSDECDTCSERVPTSTTRSVFDARTNSEVFFHVCDSCVESNADIVTDNEGAAYTAETAKINDDGEMIVIPENEMEPA